MTRIIFTYGAVSGLAIILISLGIIISGGASHTGNIFVGYLVMLVGLSSILIGVRQYRDEHLGGVIKFTTAFMLGLAIAVVASVIYVAVWEVYLAATHYTFMDNFTAHYLASQRAAGVTGEAYAKMAAEMETTRINYTHPLYRYGITFSEIFPVGLLVALISAILLKFPKFLPAKVRTV